MGSPSQISVFNAQAISSCETGGREANQILIILINAGLQNEPLINSICCVLTEISWLKVRGVEGKGEGVSLLSA